MLYVHVACMLYVVSRARLALQRTHECYTYGGQSASVVRCCHGSAELDGQDAPGVVCLNSWAFMDLRPPDHIFRQATTACNMLREMQHAAWTDGIAQVPLWHRKLCTAGLLGVAQLTSAHSAAALCYAVISHAALPEERCRNCVDRRRHLIQANLNDLFLRSSQTPPDSLEPPGLHVHVRTNLSSCAAVHSTAQHHSVPRST